MKKDFLKIINNLKKIIYKHSPELLTGFGITGMITTTIMAVKVTPKALMLIENKKKECNTEKLKPIDIIKTTWKCYVPSMIIGTMSIYCLIEANSVNLRKNTALATAYTLSESALKEYQEKVVETIGNKKEQDIKDMVAKDQIVKNPVSSNEVIITEKGNTLCYDVISGRYFKSDIEKIRKAINKINYQMLDEMYVSVNDFYYEIGLNGIKVGDELGWNIDNGPITLNFSSHLADDDTPCLVIDYNISPKYDYK